MAGGRGHWSSAELLDAADEIESALPLVLAANVDHRSPEAVDDLFARVTSRISALEAESLGNALRAVGGWANDAQLGQLASAVLPVAGTAIGTAYGGPLGAALGKTVGERAAQAISGRTAPSAPAAAGGVPAAAPGPTQAGGDGSPAATKLLYLVQNPSFLSSLVALALGSQGQSTVPVGTASRPVPVGAFMNLVTSLAGRAAQEADALAGDGESTSDSYLRSETGCLTCDPAVPEQRADALLKLLQRADEAAPMLGDMDGEVWDGDIDSDAWTGEW